MINGLKCFIQRSIFSLKYCSCDWIVARQVMSLLAVKDPCQLLPPAEVKGMKKMEREKFRKSIVVPWLEFDGKRVGGAMNILKKYSLKVPNLKSLRSTFELMEDEEVISEVQESVTLGVCKRLLLNPLLVSSSCDIVEEDREKLQKLGISQDLRFSKIILRYDNWKADELLKAILPEGNFKGYSIIGHIVHVNLRDHLLPYKEIIGQVLLDKVNGAKTVVNKTDIIDSTFRNFKMEVLCGCDKMITRTKENGNVFELDFSNVYWNPRLSTEHDRITAKLNSGDVLYDVFSGIGPFAIPAAKKKCYVLANDLNPESYKWLNVNCKLNKVQQFVKTFNKDGRIFIEKDVKKDIVQRLKNKKLDGSMLHVTMNLPALAVTFLPVFCGLLHGIHETISEDQCPVVHVYCFVSDENPETAAQSSVEKSLGHSLGGSVIEICFVRNVAPNKDMMRVSFKLSSDILCENYEPQHSITDEDEAPCVKKICLAGDLSKSTS